MADVLLIVLAWAVYVGILALGIFSAHQVDARRHRARLTQINTRSGRSSEIHEPKSRAIHQEREPLCRTPFTLR